MFESLLPPATAPVLEVEEAAAAVCGRLPLPLLTFAASARRSSTIVFSSRISRSIFSQSSRLSALVDRRAEVAERLERLRPMRRGSERSGVVNVVLIEWIELAGEYCCCC